MSDADSLEAAKTPRQRELEEQSDRLFNEGKVIEAGWTALRAKAIPEETKHYSLVQVRAAYFAGAGHTFINTSPLLSEHAETMEAYSARLNLIEMELSAELGDLDAPPMQPDGTVST